MLFTFTLIGCQPLHQQAVRNTAVGTSVGISVSRLLDKIEKDLTPNKKLRPEPIVVCGAEEANPAVLLCTQLPCYVSTCSFQMGRSTFEKHFQNVVLLTGAVGNLVSAIEHCKNYPDRCDLALLHNEVDAALLELEL